jgi:hypothetical protein
MRLAEAGFRHKRQWDRKQFARPSRKPAGMELGIFDTFSPDQRDDLATAYEAHIEDAGIAERLGYKYYFFIEHQNARYPVISAPSVFLTALGARDDDDAYRCDGLSTSDAPPGSPGSGRRNDRPALPRTHRVRDWLRHAGP